MIVGMLEGNQMVSTLISYLRTLCYKLIFGSGSVLLVLLVNATAARSYFSIELFDFRITNLFAKLSRFY
jgi:hypothetical protein